MIPTVAPDLMQLQADLATVRTDAERVAAECAALKVRTARLLQRCAVWVPVHHPRYIETPAGCMVRED